MDINVLAKLAIALALEGIIGLDLGWCKQADDEGYGDSGLRNFSPSGLFGGIAA